ncbi:MAG: hypothetical protein ACRECA_00410, partial [Pseudolabrys sp.]
GDAWSNPAGDAGARNGIVRNWVELFEAALPSLAERKTMHVASAAAIDLPCGNRSQVVALMNDETKSRKDIGPPADDYRQFSIKHTAQ